MLLRADLRRPQGVGGAPRAGVGGVGQGEHSEARAGCGSLTCWGTGMLVSWRGDTWPGLACTLVWTSRRCEDKE